MDSLLYENIPGKIISKRLINKNGYKGFDITNKTRRGDIQRYMLIITPFELLVFKMSGNNNYVQGVEGDKFFSSIRLQEIENGQINFEPGQGGFTIKLPQQPNVFLNRSSEDNIDRWEYTATNKNTGDVFLVLKKSVNNFRFLEEDTFDLGLMDESFKMSSIIKDVQLRKYSSCNGYPALDVNATLKDGRKLKAKFIIKGPHYYLLAAAGKNYNNDFTDFFSSFKFTPYKYSLPKNLVDTFLNYAVTTPIVPDLEPEMRALIEKIGDIKINIPNILVDSYWPKTKNALYKSDSTGELIAVAMQQYPTYYYIKDSTSFWDNEIKDYLVRTGFVIAEKKPVMNKGVVAGYDLILKDTNSSRRIKRLIILKNDRLYRIVSMTDSLSKESDFINFFYNTFQPLENEKPRNIFKSTIDNFLNDFFSTDSATHAKAQSSISNIYYTKKDIPKLVSAINKLPFGDKDYFDSKTRFISELGYITDTTASAEIVRALKDIYYRTADTTTFQNVVLQALAKNKSKASYKLLKELLLQDPPVFADNYEYGKFFTDIKDSLLLAKHLFPEILQLSTISDYKDDINALLVSLVDSNLITAKEYENYFTKIYFDARLELKKQQAKDERAMISEKINSDQKNYSVFTSSKTGLADFAVLLMPFYDKPEVKSFFDKLILLRDQSLQLSTAVLLLRKNKFVPDSILNNLAANDEYRIKLYKKLDKASLLNKFPAQYKTQQAIAKSIISNGKLDTIIYVSHKLMNFHNKKGNVYFFKYKLKNEDAWKIGISGLQPENSYEVNCEGELVKLTDKKIKNEDP
ncbi:MAG: hypothetical protein M3Z01_01860, partial [Thermoproteota archaeon]|nr:hypothetical protein [Thermoproteota archaeon]